MKAIYALVTAVFFSLGLAACDDGFFEEAGEETDEAVEETGEAVEEAGEEAEESIEDDN